MTQCGLVIIPLGITYTADRLNDDGSKITSSLDHVYLSLDLVPSTKCHKLENSATDHLPIVASTILLTKTNHNFKTQKAVTKRSMKNFTQTRWIDCLLNKDWTKVTAAAGVEQKVEEFTNQVNLALDECAPHKKFKIRQHFKPGLSEVAKRIMLKRDQTRKKSQEQMTQKN